MMTTYSKFRQELKTFLDDVVQHHDPLFVSRTKGENVVVLAQADYDSIMETFYLLRSPKNADRLLQAIEKYNAGGGQSRELIEE